MSRRACLGRCALSVFSDRRALAEPPPIAGDCFIHGFTVYVISGWFLAVPSSVIKEQMPTASERVLRESVDSTRPDDGPMRLAPLAARRALGVSAFSLQSDTWAFH